MGMFAHVHTCVCLAVFNSLRPMDYSPAGSSDHRILQARILEWVAISSSRGSSQPRIEPVFLVPPAGQILYHRATWEAVSSNNNI